MEIKKYKRIIEFTNDSQYIKTTDYDISANLSKLKISDDTGIFHIKEVVEVEVEVDNKNVVCTGELKDEPIVYYVNGWIYGVDEFTQEFPSESKLRSQLNFLQTKTTVPIKVVKVGDNYYLYGTKNKLWKTSKKQS